MSTLEQISKLTFIVADTGDINSIKKYQPQDATTNPTLIFKASQMQEYQYLVDDAIEFAKKRDDLSFDDKVHLCIDRLLVNFGVEILKIIPGRVSTEIDARLSFDTQKTVKRAKQIIELYEKQGIKRERVLIKIASTFEGIEAGRILEKEGIHVNMTLIFSLTQAISCGEAGVTLISPFVGRILDWYKQKHNKSGYEAQEDPGVLSVKEIFNYYKHFGYKTVVMGASFRNKEEIIELAGVDYLTISPQLLKELSESNIKIEKKLDQEKAKEMKIEKREYTESQFRWEMNENVMANDKLSEGIRVFAQDTVSLEQLIKKKLN